MKWLAYFEIYGEGSPSQDLPLKFFDGIEPSRTVFFKRSEIWEYGNFLEMSRVIVTLEGEL